MLVCPLKCLIAFPSPRAQEGMKYAALVLRRRKEKEKRIYKELLPYAPNDYEVLVRYWPEEPYKDYMSAIYCPAGTGDSPENALMAKVTEWSRVLAREAGYPDQGVINGISYFKKFFLIFVFSFFVPLRNKGSLSDSHWTIKNPGISSNRYFPLLHYSS